MTSSPDGRSVALSVRRAVPEANRYCSGLFVVGLDKKAVLVDSGEGAIFYRFPDLIGKAQFPTGIFKVVTPRWSADGASIAFLKIVDGIAQVWIAKSDGSGGSVATHAPADVEDFRFGTDGSSIIYRTEDATAQLVQREREGRNGYHFDDRFSPISSNRPYLRGPLPSTFGAVDLRTRSSRPATPVEVALLQDRPGKANALGWIARTESLREGGKRVSSQRNGRSSPCLHDNCRHVIGQPWIAGRHSIRYLRREGWAASLTSIYEWTIGTAAPHLLYTTSDLLVECIDLSSKIICVREASTEPRRIVQIDPMRSSAATIFNPNLPFDQLRRGTVRRLNWRNDRGIECFGDLVLPTDYVVGRRYPLIVVQYTSRGFLRGGTGDEFPVQAFANNGYAVLNLERPASPVRPGPEMTGTQAERRNLEGFAERQSILSALETAVRDLVSGGIVDADKIGITGLSDGSSTVQFSLLHSNLFAAASATGCCWEPSQAWTLGPGIQALYQRNGWPAFLGDNHKFWREISLSRNAARVRTPLLLQSPDDEYLGALEAYTALTEADAAVDLYVYPDEHHIKRQPSHRLAVYRRNLDWFDFWLKGEVPRHSLDKEEEMARWTRLRTALMDRDRMP
jgi:dipeptidyl aminopeptidase/acylaminoacyl peptidase